MDIAEIDPERPLASYGLDSVMGVTLIGDLERWLDCQLDPKLAYECQTISELVQAIGLRREKEEKTSVRIRVHGPLERYPLSYSQRSFWFLHEIAPDSAAYNVALAIRITSALDISRFQTVLAQLLGRHRSLWVNFSFESGEPVQYVSGGPQFTFQVVDAAGWDEEQLRSQVKSDYARPFDLEKDPLVRITLWSLSPDHHVLLFTIPHIVVDFWSLYLLLEDLGKLYSDHTGELPVLPSRHLEYSDWVTWQSEFVSTQGEQLWEHWNNRLAGSSMTLDLPTSFPRGPVQSHKGASVTFAIDTRLSDEIRALAKRHGATLYSVLMAGFDALLHRYSGQEDLLVGSPVSGRDQSGIDDLVGCFINMVVLRSTLSGETTVQNLLDQARRTAMDALANQDFPFGLLVERLQQARDPNRTPVFQVMFALQTLQRFGDLSRLFVPNSQIREVSVGALTLQAYDLPQQEGQFDLALEIAELDGSLFGVFKYDTALFDRVTIERMLGHYRNLLREFTSDGHRLVNALPLLGPAELQQVLVDWNSKPVASMRNGCIHELFERQVEAGPDRTALRAGEVDLTYAELNCRANVLAHHLRDLGIGPDGLVGVCTRRSSTLIVALLAVLKAGGAYIPLDPAYPLQRLGAMLNDSHAPVVITESAFTELFEGRKAKTIFLDQLPEQPSRIFNPTPISTERNLAYVLYTSGSTGTPKGVAIEHRSAVALLKWAAEFFTTGLKGGLASTSVCFDLSVFEIFTPLICGGKVLLAENALALPDLSYADNVTLINTVPSAMAELLRMKAVPESVTTVCLAGEPLLRSLVDEIYSLKQVKQVANLYGPTEATTYSTFAVVERACGRAPSIGRAVAGTQAYVVDQLLQPVPVGVVGDLYLGGVGLARCYLNQPAATAARFIPDSFTKVAGARLYRTGDKVCWSSQGELQFLGRSDNQVKVRGFRIELEEIEVVLRRHADVKDAVVVAAADALEGKKLVAYIVPASSLILSASNFRVYLKEKLPAYMVPGTFMFLKSLPMTPNGKVDRRALPPVESIQSGKDSAMPCTDLEKRLAAVWSAVLRVEKIGIDDDFFALGGHSLLAARLVSYIRDELKVTVPLATLYRYPTVRSIGEFISSAKEHEPDSSLLPRIVPSPANANKPFPLTDVQMAYWIGRNASIEMGGVSSHVYFEFDSPDLEVGRVQMAVRGLVQRHGMLRAVIAAEGSQQILSSVPPYVVQVTDLRDFPEEARQLELKALRNRLSHQVLLSDQWPLFEIRITRLPETVRLHVSIDALIADALSLVWLARDFSIYYQNPEAQLPALTLSFRDYVLGEASIKASMWAERSAAYWQKRLPLLPSSPELPVLHNRSVEEQSRFVRFQSRLDRPAWDRFRKGAARARITPSVGLLAAYAEVLSCWSKEPVFTINVTLFNRHPLHPEVEQLVGDFTSLLPLAVDTRGNASIEERARLLNAQLWEDFDHRYTSGIELLRQLARIQKRPLSALMPVVFTSVLPVQEGPSDAGRIQWPGELAFSISQTPQVWLDHQVFEDNGELVLTWDVVEALFPAGMIERMFGAYCKLLQQMASADATWEEISGPELPALDMAVHLEMNQTDAPVHSATLHELFERHAQKFPDDVAVIAPDRILSYGELNALSQRLAVRLLNLGVQPNRLVGVALPKGWQQVVATLAILRAGSAYLPLDLSLPSRRLHDLCVIGEVGNVLCLPGGVPHVEWPAGVTLVPVEDNSDRAEAQISLPSVSPSDLAYVIFTSGSTGTPKGVVIDHRGAVNTIEAINSRFDVKRGDRVLAVSSLSFDLSVYDLFGTLAAGGAIVMPASLTRPDPQYWLEVIQQHRVTLWNSVPALMEMLVNHLTGNGSELPPSLRLVMMSGDWIPMTLPGRIRQIADTVEIYGLGGATEASIWSNWFHIREVDPAWKSIPYGRPMPNQRMYVLDSALHPRPIWVPGEIYIAGIGLAKGYWKDPERTSLSFIVHPETGELLYRTGDMGRYREDGNIEFLGREDSQLKIRGFRIEIGEIEAALLAHPDVRMTAVVAHGENARNKYLVAYIVLNPNASTSVAALRSHLSSLVPHYMVPPSIRIMDSLPLSSNGKVDRKAILDIGTPKREISGAFPETETEYLVQSIWREVLGFEDVGVDENFFEVGGDSVLIVTVRSRLSAALQRDIRIIELFQFPTIRDLAAKLDGDHLGSSVETSLARGDNRRERLQQRRKARTAN